jgi:hypothetical protein
MFQINCCRGNQNIHFIFRAFFFFQKIVPSMRYCRKMWWSQRGRRLQYGGPLHAGLVRLHARKHTPAPVIPHTLAHAVTHERARAHTHIEICNSYYFGIRDAVVGIATRYGLESPGIESRWGARFSAPIQTGSEAHPASCTLATRSFPGVKEAGAWR